MTVRGTSAESHALNDHAQIKDRVLRYVADHGPCTRREIATRLGVDTATVAGIVKPAVDRGDLVEAGKIVCRITGRNALRLEWPVKQPDMFEECAA